MYRQTRPFHSWYLYRTGAPGLLRRADSLEFLSYSLRHAKYSFYSDAVNGAVRNQVNHKWIKYYSPFPTILPHIKHKKSPTITGQLVFMSGNRSVLVAKTCNRDSPRFRSGTPVFLLRPIGFQPVLFKDRNFALYDTIILPFYHVVALPLHNRKILKCLNTRNIASGVHLWANYNT